MKNLNKNQIKVFTVNIVNKISNQISNIKLSLPWILLVLMVIFMAISHNKANSTVAKTPEKTANDIQLDLVKKKFEEKEKEDQRIGEYVLFIMNFSKIAMSDFQKQLLAQTIVRVSGQIFDTELERQYMIVLINNESGFDRNAKSNAGAVGLTQVMPQFISEFGSHCGIDVSKSEVFDTEANLLLGACRFKHLLNAYKGVVTTALAAYNAGKHAKSVKELQQLERITNQETLQYIARFAHVTATADANFKFKKTTEAENDEK